MGEAAVCTAHASGRTEMGPPGLSDKTEEAEPEPGGRESPGGKRDEPSTSARLGQTDGQAGKTSSAGKETGSSLGPFLPCRGPECRVTGLLERIARHVSFLRPRRGARSST